MKTIKILSILLIMGMISFSGQAQSKTNKWQTDTISVPAQCGMCKDKIEETLAFEKGVKKSEVDIEKDIAVVTFNIKKTDLDKIRKAISEIGYDADNVAANPKAYAKLPGCCKKPDDPDHQPHQ